MHEGEWSSRLGIAGQPAEAEELMVMRDIALARLTGAQVHFQHMSTAGSMAMIAGAKAAGLAITCEATTHHFTLTHANCATYDPVFKVNPPLRTADDVAAVKRGAGRRRRRLHRHRPRPARARHQGAALRRGAARDARPRDGAGPGPHRTRPRDRAGRRSAVVEAGRHHRRRRPARPSRSSRATRPTSPCSTPTEEWTVDATAMQSRSRNTPYAGRRVRGRVRHTILEGEAVVLDGEPTR